MFTEEESKVLVNVNSILSETDLDYFLLVRNKCENAMDEDSYFTAGSSFSKEANLYFVRSILELIYSSMMEYLPEDEKPKEDKHSWMKNVVEEAINDKVHFELKSLN